MNLRTRGLQRSALLVSCSFRLLIPKPEDQS